MNENRAEALIQGMRLISMCVSEIKPGWSILMWLDD